MCIMSPDLINLSEILNMSSTRNTFSEYWIIPLMTNELPYKTTIEDLKNFHAEEALIIPVLIMNQFVKSDHSKQARFTLQELRQAHQLGCSKIILKDMGEPFGMGGFAGPQGFPANTRVFYSGIYFEIGNNPGSTDEYCAAISDSISIDGGNVNGKARFLQHLPDASHLLERDFLELLEHVVATENVRHRTTHLALRLEDCDYVIPVSECLAFRNIAANEIIGFSYGEEYWNSFAKAPSLFNPVGETLDLFTIQLLTEQGLFFRFALTSENEAEFRLTRAIRASEFTLFILPPTITLERSGLANGMHVPALYLINSATQTAFLGNTPAGIVIQFDCDSKQSKSLIDYFRNINIGLKVYPLHGKFRMNILLDDLIKLNFADAKIIFTKLNANISNGDCQFTAIETRDFRVKLTAISGTTHRFFPVAPKISAAVKNNGQQEDYLPVALR
jgi:hypothetical protein